MAQGIALALNWKNNTFKLFSVDISRLNKSSPRLEIKIWFVLSSMFK